MLGAKHAAILRRHQHCLKMERSETPHDPRHLGVPSGASKTIFDPMVRSVQTVHLSCIKISPISKWTEMSYDLSLVTQEYHRVCSKRFLSLWHVLRKLCTYLASRLGPLGASKTISEPMARLAQTVHLSCTDTNTVSKWTKIRFHMTHVT